MSDETISSTDKGQCPQDETKPEIPGVSSTDKDQSLQDEIKPEIAGISSTDEGQCLQKETKPVIPGISSTDKRTSLQISGISSLETIPSLETDAMPVYNTADSMTSLNQMIHNLQLGNTAIRATNMQIGVGQTMICSSTEEPPKLVNPKLLKPFLESKRIIVKEDLNRIPCMGSRWRGIGRSLGFVSGDLDALEYDYRRLQEISYQLLYKWLEKETPNCTVGILAKALNDHQTHEVILKLPNEG